MTHHGMEDNAIRSRHRRRQRGQSAVEFSLGAIVMILLLGGLIDLSRAFYFDIGIHGAAYSAARHAAWFDFGERQNKYLDDTDIVNAANQALAGSGLTAVNQNACPNGSGNSVNNPPYAASNYPTGYDTVNLFICYTQPGHAPVASIATAPGVDDSSWRGGDINVILLMNYGLATGFMQGVLNAAGGIHVAANTHFTIQGGY